ncbi:protein hinderin-like isoform X1 [Acipenser oxyrinchus oxyrinchus]|uniref:Protein hinderin-like isoform X1 n=1 Tax=Acipenser oxyrinchus oxyrinchus TaxID=40147 RepID=A0AAD8LRR0_ACIOX|nr:protein hinderin-like isoform X1 [Acipenser oxyrinchus oxyrinchus]
MADVVYWSKDLSDEDQPMVVIPGLTKKGNLRMGLTGKGRRSVEGIKNVAARVSDGPDGSLKESKEGLKKVAAPRISEGSVHSLKKSETRQANANQILADPAEGRSASLKDLCPEDKRRIANLIQELARVSEEKDETAERLRVEQEGFSKKIQQLEAQNEFIANERENILPHKTGCVSCCLLSLTAPPRLQDQYLECQELLALYQQYLSEQQEKLTRSISQLNHTHTTQQQQSCGKRSPTLLPQAAVDGSYLGLPSPRRGSGGLNFRMPPSHRDKNRVALGRQAHSPLQQGTLSGSGSEDGSPEYWGLPLRPQLGGSEPRPGRPDQLREARLMNGELRRAGMTEPCVGWHSHHRKAQGSGRQVPEVSLTGLEPPPPADVSEPQGSRGLSDERRHRLMLQKLELEVERERLQALLAQQEEKLLRQQRQLSQSRLDYSRFQDAAMAELEESIHDVPLSEPGQRVYMNGSITPGLSLFPAQPESRLSATPVQEKSRAPPVQEDWEEEPRSVIEDLCSSRRDACTSPAFLPTATFPQPDPGYDASLIELLEALTPISKRSLHSPSHLQRSPTLTPAPTLRGQLSTVKPRPSPSCRRSPRTHSSSLGYPLEELQESQILEEIFFIC